MLSSLNPLKRVKFISIDLFLSFDIGIGLVSQSPQTGQVYFNADIQEIDSLLQKTGLNPLKRVKFISIHSQLLLTFKRVGAVSIPSNGSSLFQYSGLENLWRYLGQ